MILISPIKSTEKTERQSEKARVKKRETASVIVSERERAREQERELEHWSHRALSLS